MLLTWWSGRKCKAFFPVIGQVLFIIIFSCFIKHFVNVVYMFMIDFIFSRRHLTQTKTETRENRSLVTKISGKGGARGDYYFSQIQQCKIYILRTVHRITFTTIIRKEIIFRGRIYGAFSSFHAKIRCAFFSSLEKCKHLRE